jgi:hypothetical protein
MLLIQPAIERKHKRLPAACVGDFNACQVPGRAQAAAVMADAQGLHCTDVWAAYEEVVGL